MPSLLPGHIPVCSFIHVSLDGILPYIDFSFPSLSSSSSNKVRLNRRGSCVLFQGTTPNLFACLHFARFFDGANTVRCLFWNSLLFVSTNPSIVHLHRISSELLYIFLFAQHSTSFLSPSSILEQTFQATMTDFSDDPAAAFDDLTARVNDLSAGGGQMNSASMAPDNTIDDESSDGDSSDDDVSDNETSDNDPVDDFTGTVTALVSTSN